MTEIQLATPVRAGADQWRWFVLACLLCSVPVLWFEYPPMLDLPQHAANIEAIKRVLGGGWEYAGLFEITYLNPYWLGYAAVLLLSIPLGIVLACKLVVATAAVAFPLSAGLFLRRMRVDPVLYWLLLPLPFGFAYEWGFLNFLVAAPLGFLFLNSVLAGQQEKRRLAWLHIVLWVHVLFFAHILTAGFFCAIAVVLLAQPWDGLAGWIRRTAPVFSVFPVLVAYVVFSMVGVDIVSDPAFWNLGLHRLVALPDAFTSAPSSITALALSGVLLAAPLLAGYRLRREPAFYFPVALYLLVMLVGPQYIFGNAYNYQRFGFFGFPLYLLCFNYLQPDGRALSHRALLRGSLMSVAVLLLAWQVLRGSTFEREYDGFDEVISAAAPGKRMLIFAVDRYSVISDTPLYLHFASWYQAKTGGPVDFSFASMYTIIQYKDRPVYPVREPFAWNPLSFDWNAHRAESYDYFIFRSFGDPTAWMMERSACRVSLTSHAGAWWLFHRESDHAVGCPETAAGDRPSTH